MNRNVRKYLKMTKKWQWGEGCVYKKWCHHIKKNLQFFNYSHRRGAKKTSSGKLLAAEDSPRYLQTGYVQSLLNICRKEQKKFVRPYREDSWVLSKVYSRVQGQKVGDFADFEPTYFLNSSVIKFYNADHDLLNGDSLSSCIQPMKKQMSSNWILFPHNSFQFYSSRALCIILIRKNNTFHSYI